MAHIFDSNTWDLMLLIPAHGRLKPLIQHMGSGDMNTGGGDGNFHVQSEDLESRSQSLCIKNPILEYASLEVAKFTDFILLSNE